MNGEVPKGESRRISNASQLQSYTHSPKRLGRAEIGIKRLSLGPGPMYAAMGLLRKIAQELKQNETHDALLAGAITFDELNALAEPRHAA